MRKTRGWAALCAALEAETQVDLKEKTKVPQSVISSLVTRSRLPGDKTKGKLEKIGIKAAWWNEGLRRSAA